MTIESGTQFGAYTIEGPIAGGGMGQVYAARHNVYGSVVALKVLHKQLHADAEWRLRFNLEGVIGQQLKHPHVVAARELVEHDEHVAIVLDLVSGGLTLHRCISREYSGGLPLDQALRVFLAIVQGVEYAHGKMVTHGDIKPENVLIEGAYRDPTTWVAKVTDFGTVGIMAHPVMIDGRAAVVVSPRYAAPEHLLGIDRIERRSDIYCLGLMLHYLLTGKHASTARTVEEAAVNTSKPLSMLALVDQPEPLRAIIQKACARDIGERYSTCGELALAVRQAMDTLGVVFEVEDVAADLATEMMPERDAMRRGEVVDGLTLDPGEPLTTGSAQDGIDTEHLGPDDIDPAVRAAAMFASEGAGLDDASEAGDGESEDDASAESSDNGDESSGVESESSDDSETADDADGSVDAEAGDDEAEAADDAEAVDDAEGAGDADAGSSDDADEADAGADDAADADVDADDAADAEAADDGAEDSANAGDAADSDAVDSDAAGADADAADSDAADSDAADSDAAGADADAADSDAAGADADAADFDGAEDCADADDGAEAEPASDAEPADDAEDGVGTHAGSSDDADDAGADAEPDSDADDDDDIDPRLDPALAQADPNSTFGGEFFTGENPALTLDDDADAEAAAPDAPPSSGGGVSTGVILAGVVLVVVVLGLAALAVSG